MSPDGRDQTLIASGGQGSLWPSWSPDGQKIVFVSDRDLIGTDDVYVTNADGTHVVRLTNDAALDVDPSWSPDGKKIIFTSYRGSVVGKYSQVYVMNANGRNQRRLTDNPGWNGAPQWQPIPTTRPKPAGL